MANFILRMALTGWKMGHYMGIVALRETSLLIPLTSIDARKAIMH